MRNPLIWKKNERDLWQKRSYGLNFIASKFARREDESHSKYVDRMILRAAVSFISLVIIIGVIILLTVSPIIVGVVVLVILLILSGMWIAYYIDEYN